ncbi:uncharacterized protein EV420DRAFT_616836 [Desarmillaria tabescens]|uniref:Acetoacetate decarboxylase n=1 Tax=Armillaria tabescens TaxID=1929756 RepID=A0AA39K6D4_ARMTA|nr:uncharacterized protein EV420DRAFT_616836 [Desarmillaria tabescens]KAK0454044.1 hypothetical protein EV420DRAFT_616836 [Desarmillaria tabescens]
MTSDTQSATAQALSKSGIPEAPAPWDLKARSWTFVLSPLSKQANFPAGWAAPYQAEALAGSGEFIGGPGMIMVVSYTETPVGPYDEVIYMPGRWKYADGTTGARITRIYVSTAASMENGRRNWNIPKQVASFSFTEDPTTSAWSLTVSPLDNPSTPFFKVSVGRIPLLSSFRIPFTSKILGSLNTIVQPPLPQGSLPEEVGTEKGAVFTPLMKQMVRFTKMKGEFEDGKVGDGIGFPAVVPWGLAYQMEDVVMDFVVPEWRDELR